MNAGPIEGLDSPPSPQRRWLSAIPTFALTGAVRPAGREAGPRRPTWPLLVRAWPYLNRYIAGRWRHIGPRPADESRGGLLFMPVLVTGLWLAALALTPAAVALAHKRGGALALADLAGAATMTAAWMTCLLHGRAGKIAAALGAAAAVAAALLASPAPPLALAYAATLLVFISGWFVRLRIAGGPTLSVRTGSHLIYFYLLSFVAVAGFMLTTLITSSLLFQGILIGQPLAPGLARLLGRPDLSHGRLLRAGARLLDPEQRRAVLFDLIGVGIALWCFLRPFQIGVPYYAAWIMQQINQSLRLDLLEQWSRLSPRYHTGHRVGDSIYRSYLDSAQITNIVGRLYTAVTDLLGIAQFAAVLALFDLRIAALGVGMTLPIVAAAYWYTPRLGMRATAAREANSNLVSRAQEVFAGIRVIRAFGQEDREQARFEADSVAAFNAACRARWFFVSIGVFAFTAMALFIMPAQYLMAVWAAHGQAILAGALFVLLNLAYRNWNVAALSWGGDQLDQLANKVRGLNTEWAAMQDNMSGLHRVFEILSAKPEIEDAAGAVRFEAPRREIRFEDVCFSYEAGAPTLHNITFAATTGAITAVVGPTGSGKSTLLTLLLRIYDPDSGRILVDGRDLREFGVDSLRDSIAVVPQEPILFARSIADNIRYAAPQCEWSTLQDAAAIACVDEFVESMPLGYDTMLGDRGDGLSQGQRQRICIARALVRNAPILMLDEPTAALDAQTEQAVMSNLARWREGRIVFVVTHRLSTVRAADQILFVEGGKLKEAGSHDALMAIHGGRYRAMVEAEAGLNALAEAAT